MRRTIWKLFSQRFASRTGGTFLRVEQLETRLAPAVLYTWAPTIRLGLQGRWVSYTNWSINGVPCTKANQFPHAGDDVVIGDPGGADAFIPCLIAPGCECASLTIEDSPVTIKIGPASSLTINNGGTMASGSFDVQGSLVIGGGTFTWQGGLIGRTEGNGGALIVGGNGTAKLVIKKRWRNDAGLARLWHLGPSGPRPGELNQWPSPC